MKLQGVWSWGSNKFGQLGLGNQIKKSLPRPNNFFFGMKMRCIFLINWKDSISNLLAVAPYIT